MRRIQSFMAEVDDDVVSVKLVFDTTKSKDIDDAIRELKRAKKELTHPRYECELAECDNTFIRGSGSRPKRYCCPTHRVRDYRRRKKLEALA